MVRKLVGLDIETVDPLLKTAGWSWKYGQGKVLCTALHYDGEGTKTIPGLHNENCPYNEQERKEANEEIRNLLLFPEVSIVGANLQYDIGWLLYEYGMSTYDVKCRFIDVFQAEHILNEFTETVNLEDLSWKYLKFGKRKAEIEKWIFENVPKAKGDFRKYLEFAPWDLLVDYVEGDAENPVKIWKKQLTLLKQQDLCERCKIEFDAIKPILQLTINGFPFDNEQRKKNLEELKVYRDRMASEFAEKYKDAIAYINIGKRKAVSFKVTSSKHIASLCDFYKIPYKYKITLKGENGHAYVGDEDRDGMNRAKKVVASFRMEKKKPVAYVPVSLIDRTCDLLKEEGFMFTSSPNVDKKFFESQRNNYEVIDLIANWKLCEGIISKILGDEFERFVCPDGRIRPQFNITDTVSFRLSSCKPNGQQIPSKGGFRLSDGTEVSFPKITRALFKPEKGKSYFKIDYGQIEYRLICNIAVGKGSKEVREEFARNPRLDFHQYVVDLTGLSRKFAKNMSFGVSFGMGLPSMCESFGWTLEHGQEISDQYHEHMPFVAPTLALVGDVAKQRGYIRTVFGSHARLRSPNFSYTMLNRYTQGSGAEIMKTAIIQAYNEGVWRMTPFHVTVHDELGFSVAPVEEEVRNAFRMSEIMTTCAPMLKVPLIADIEIGDDWYNVHEIGEWKEFMEQDSEEWQNASEATKENVRISLKIMEEQNGC